VLLPVHNVREALPSGVRILHRRSWQTRRQVRQQACEIPKREERAKNENLLDSRLGPDQDAQQQARSAIASGGQSVERQMTFVLQF
jgi:hypothetical protein